jgi:hypothetical protein
MFFQVFNVVSTNAYRSCHWCGLKGCYIHSIHKMVYMGTRKCLPKASKLRDDDQKFPVKKKEYDDMPPTLTFEDEMIARTRCVL